MATLQELLLAKLMEKNGRAPASFGDSMFPEASPTPQPYYGSKLNYQESLPPEPTPSQEEAPLPQSLSQPSKLYAAPFDLTRPNKSSASEDDILKAQLLREPIQEQQQQQQVAQQDPSIAAATDEYKLAELLRTQQLSMMGGMSSAFKKNQAQLSDDIALQRKLMQLEAGRAPANDPSGTIGMYLANAGYKPSEIQAATKQYQPEDEGKTADRLRKSLEGVSNLQDKMTDNDVQRLKIGLSMAQNKASGAESSKMFKRLTDFQKAIDPSAYAGIMPCMVLWIRYCAPSRSRDNISMAFLTNSLALAPFGWFDKNCFNPCMLIIAVFGTSASIRPSEEVPPPDTTLASASYNSRTCWLVIRFKSPVLAASDNGIASAFSTDCTVFQSAPRPFFPLACDGSIAFWKSVSRLNILELSAPDALF